MLSENIKPTAEKLILASFPSLRLLFSDSLLLPRVGLSPTGIIVLARPHSPFNLQTILCDTIFMIRVKDSRLCYKNIDKERARNKFGNWHRVFVCLQGVAVGAQLAT